VGGDALGNLKAASGKGGVGTRAAGRKTGRTLLLGKKGGKLIKKRLSGSLMFQKRGERKEGGQLSHRPKAVGKKKELDCISNGRKLVTSHKGEEGLIERREVYRWKRLKI